MKIILTEKEWEQLQEYAEWCSKTENPCDICTQDRYWCCGCEKEEAYQNEHKQRRLNDEIMNLQIIKDYLETNHNLNDYKNLMEEYSNLYNESKRHMLEIKDKINIEFVRN